MIVDRQIPSSSSPSHFPQLKPSAYKQVISAYCPPSESVRSSPRELKDSHAFRLTKSPKKQSLIQQQRDRQIQLNKFLLCSSPATSALAADLAAPFPHASFSTEEHPCHPSLVVNPHHQVKIPPPTSTTASTVANTISSRKPSGSNIWSTIQTKSSAIMNTELSAGNSSIGFDILKSQNGNTKKLKDYYLVTKRIISSTATTSPASGSQSPIRSVNTAAGVVNAEQDVARGTSDHFLTTLNEFKSKKVKEKQQQQQSLFVLGELQTANHNDKVFLSQHRKAITSTFESKFLLEWEGIQKKKQQQQQQQQQQHHSSQPYHHSQITRLKSSDTKIKSRKVTALSDATPNQNESASGMHSSRFTTVEEIFARSRVKEWDSRKSLQQPHQISNHQSILLTDFNQDSLYDYAPYQQQQQQVLGFAGMTTPVITQIGGNHVTHAYDFPIEGEINEQSCHSYRGAPKRGDFGFRVKSLSRSRRSGSESPPQKSMRGRVRTAAEAASNGNWINDSSNYARQVPPGTGSAVRKKDVTPFENDSTVVAEWGERASVQFHKFRQVDYLNTQQPGFSIFSEDLNKRIHKIYAQEKSFEQVERQKKSGRSKDQFMNLSRTFDVNPSKANVETGMIRKS